MESEKTIWDEFVEGMNRYFHWYFLDDFDQNKMYVLDESRLQLNNKEFKLNIWFVYKWEDSKNIDMVFHAVVNLSTKRFSIDRYDFDHDAGWDILDSQESHTV